MRLTTFAIIALLVTHGAAWAGKPPHVRIGSNQFTESVILAELATQLCRDAGLAAIHRAQLGGTQLLWEALLRGDIDAYPEYTGTLRQEIFARLDVADDAALAKALADVGI